MKIISNIKAIIIKITIVFKLNIFISGNKIKLEINIKKGIIKNKYQTLNNKLYNVFSDFIKKKCTFNAVSKYSIKNKNNKPKIIKICLQKINKV